MPNRILRNISILILLTVVSLSAQQRRREYFTEAEIDTIREAQGLKLRLPAYFRLADLRLTSLGLKPKSEKELEQERKLKEQHDKQVAEAAKAGRRAPASLELPTDYLLDYTRSELLRGYIQAVDEVMSNIDDAFSRRLDVRDALEELEEYLSAQMPLLEKFEPRSNVEETAIEEAVEITQRALEDARGALETIPKTEQSNRN